MEVPATAKQLQDFGEEAAWGIQDFGTIVDVNMYVDTADVVLFGRLGTSGPGRIEYLGPGIYFEHANLELLCVEVIKGSMPVPSQPAYLELDWALGKGVDRLMEVTPLGARVIFLGGYVKDALESAQAVDAEGDIGAVDRVKTNLFSVPFNGLLVEGVNGKTYTPLYDGPLFVNGPDELANFEDAMAIIRATADRYY